MGTVLPAHTQTHRHTHQHTAIYPGSTPGNQHYPCELLNGHLVKKDNSSAARDSRDKLPEHARTHVHVRAHNAHMHAVHAVQL